MKGRLIVLEGTDGSGKSTQFGRLCQRLEQAEIPFQKLVFPQYQEPSSALIRMYLAGEFGTHPSDVNAYAASAFYAVDRYASYKKVWGEWYEGGGFVVADRYTTSNAVHQASKLPNEEREAFFQWLCEFEYDKLGLPAPDQVIYLDVPTDTSVQMLRARESATNTHADIHEQDTDYLRTCRETASQAADCLNWYRVKCVSKGEMRTIEDISEEIWTVIRPIIEK